MPRISEMPRPGPMTGLEMVPAIQGGGADANCGIPLLLTGAPFGGAVLALRAPMTADLASTTDGDPGSGGVRWDNADPDQAATLYISDEDGDTGNLATLLAALAVGGYVYLQGGADSAARDNLQKWQVTSVAPGAGYTKVGVSLQDSGGVLTDGDVLEVTLQQPLPAPGVNRNIVTPLASSSGVVTVDCSLGDYFTLALGENVDSWIFQNVPPGCSIMIEITQDDTARTITWPVGFTWAGAAAAVTSSGAGAVDVLAISTFTGGSSWRATLGKDFSS